MYSFLYLYFSINIVFSYVDLSSTIMYNIVFVDLKKEKKKKCIMILLLLLVGVMMQCLFYLIDLLHLTPLIMIICFAYSKNMSELVVMH